MNNKKEKNNLPEKSGKTQQSLNRFTRVRAPADGFTLIEVMVALVVLTVGMLGIAVLYVEGLKLNRTAIFRTTAVTLAADMAERIQANKDNVPGYAGTGPGQNNNCSNPAPGIECTIEQLTEDDWFRWQQAIAAQLPQGASGEIGVAADGGNNRVDIEIVWPEIGEPGPVSFMLSIIL